MDIQTDTNMMDEQELAKALADVEATNTAIIAENSKKARKVDVKDDEVATGVETPAEQPAANTVAPENTTQNPNTTNNAGDIADNTPTNMAASSGTALGLVKSNALQDLKPLVDKLDISPEEKFDIYLLIFKSSNDPDVVEPAYNVAKQITDEAKRASALLEVIKEVDAIESPSSTT